MGHAELNLAQKLYNKWMHCKGEPSTGRERNQDHLAPGFCPHQLPREKNFGGYVGRLLEIILWHCTDTQLRLARDLCAGLASTLAPLISSQMLLLFIISQQSRRKNLTFTPGDLWRQFDRRFIATHLKDVWDLKSSRGENLDNGDGAILPAGGNHPQHWILSGCGNVWDRNCHDWAAVGTDHGNTRGRGSILSKERSDME